jgi:Aspartyl protease
MGNALKKTTPFLPNKGKSVAAILPEDTPMSSKEDDVVPAVMPSAVLGNSSFSKGDVSPTLHKKHLILEFQIATQHLDFPLKFNAMLDNGTHVVLIHPDTVSELQLERFKLKKPEKVSVAISDKKKETMTLINYVKFSVTSLDNAWTSKPIFAIIAPGLCLPLILGLPFLVKNNIVIDHADRTAVDKVSSYDLLNPPIIKLLHCPPSKLHENIKQTKRIKKKVLSELLTLCNNRIKNGTLLFKNVKEVNCIRAVHNAIKKLSAEERLIKLGIKVKSDFPDIFEPIPHADLLPSNYLTHIKLKDAEK